MSSTEHPFKDYPGGDRIRPLTQLEVENQRVFVRVDFNVPIQDGKITDDTRIRSAIPTLQYLLDKGAHVICASHLGRPSGNGYEEAYSMEPVAERLGELLGRDVVLSENCTGHAVIRQSKDIKKDQILLLENLRFFAGETENAQEFAYKLSQLAEVYVNDAFGTCHRAHASVDALPRLMKNKAAGFLLEKEVVALGKLVHNPARPLIAILGGAKVSDKVKVIEALMIKSSKILIGGAMAYTFLKAKQIPVGSSRVEMEKVALAGKLLERSKKANCELVLPIDHVCGKSFDNPGNPVTTAGVNIPDALAAFDIGPQTEALFKKHLESARSIFWNGPLGVFEKEPFDHGTTTIAKVIAELDAPYKICGGGDSVAAIHKAGAEAGFTHISTGGGASLEMIEGVTMPGIEALKPVFS